MPARDYAEPFERPTGPQLTEHTGNRIATALERIADAMEKTPLPIPAARDPLPFDARLLWNTYPLGDPAPIPTGRTP